MEPFARQQFDMLLGLSVERLVDRVEQRCGGPVPALERLRRDPNGDGIWIDDYVRAVFGDFLLDGTAGATFVLGALARRAAPPLVAVGGETIDAFLQRAARAAFRDVLLLKAEEALEQRQAFQVTD